MRDESNEPNKPNKKDSGPKHSHSGHRERMKSKVIKNGFGSLCDHELLELLLFYAIPRRDTNETAHQLIERFGSLHATLEAEPDEICEVPGLSQSSALLIKTVLECAARYNEGASQPVLYYDNLQKVGNFLRNIYFGIRNEQMYVLLFDNRMKLLDAVKVGEGTVNATSVNLNLMVTAAVRHHAAAMILAHNHPDGSVIPSAEDMFLTRRVYDFFQQISIPLLEHIIVSGKEYYPVMHYSGQYDFSRSPSDSFDEEFFHRFFHNNGEALTLGDFR